MAALDGVLPELIGAAGAAGGGAEVVKSLRFYNDYSQYLTRTPSSAGNRRTFTFSTWLKRSYIDSSAMRRFFSAGATSVSSGNVTLAFYQDTLFFQISTSTYRITSSQVFRDPTAWYHIVLAVDTTQATSTDRVKFYVNGVQITDFGTAGYPTQNLDTAVNNTEQQLVGCGVDSGGAVPDGAFDGYMADCYLIDGSALDPTSFGSFDDSGVWQVSSYSGSYGTNGFHLFDFANESAIGHDSSGNENDYTGFNFLAETGQYLDHITGTERSGFEWAQMFDANLDQGAVPNPGSSFTFTPSPSISFTTLALYAYKDSSPGQIKINGTDITSQVPNHNGIGPNQRTVITGLTSPFTSLQNISLGSLANVVVAGIEIDGELLLDTGEALSILFDVPVNGDQGDTGAGGELSGNYCTWNPLSPVNPVISNGALDVQPGNNGRANSTMSVSSGKWYWEAKLTARSTYGSASANLIGLGDIENTGEIGYQSTSWGYRDDGQKLHNTVLASYGAAFAIGDIIGIAFDADNGTLTFYKNGSSQGQAYSGISGSYGPIAGRNGSATADFAFNFGQRPFAYSAPTDHKALCTTNLTASTIGDGQDYFEAIPYAGNGASNTVTGTQFTPSFVWLKSRGGAYSHFLHDIVRGGTKAVFADNTNAEYDYSPSGVTSFNSNGFTVNGAYAANYVGSSNIAWAWNGGSSTTTVNAGDENSSNYDSSAVWSSAITLSGGSTAVGKPLTNGFDGNLSTATEGDSTNEYAELAISTTIAAGGVRVYAAVTSGNPLVINLYNGGSNVETVSAGSSGAKWYSTSTYAGPITKIRIERTGRAFEFNSVEVNGKRLLDTGVTPVDNFPSIASSVRASTTAGFSVVTFTGTGSNETVAHGLSAEPYFLLTKCRESGFNWAVYHQNTGNTGRWMLNNTLAFDTSSTFWNDTTPTSSLFSIGSFFANGNTFVAYCFAPVEGYSKFGTYIGNGSTNGTYVYLGFKPRFVLLRNASVSGNDWKIFDGARDPDNVVTQVLSPNSTSAELFNNGLDFLANGFKWRDSGSAQNGNGNEIIYAAFAENPFQANGGLAR